MALPAILAYLARHGFAKAAKKYGEKAVLAAGKNRRKVTKAEEKAGMGGNVPTKTPDVPRSKMPGGGRMPPNQADKKAAQAARRAENKAAQMARGKKNIAKGAAGAVGAGTAIAGAANLLNSESKPKPKKPQATKTQREKMGSKARAGDKIVQTTAAKDATKKKNSSRKKSDAAIGAATSGSLTPRTVGAAKKAGRDTFVDRKGRRKAAVTREELEESGLSLRDYLNKERGLTRRKDMKKGGAVKKTTKAKASKPKVRGVGIAKKGFRPAKMR